MPNLKRSLLTVLLFAYFASSDASSKEIIEIVAFIPGGNVNSGEKIRHRIEIDFSEQSVEHAFQVGVTKIPPEIATPISPQQRQQPSDANGRSGFFLPPAPPAVAAPPPAGLIEVPGINNDFRIENVHFGCCGVRFSARGSTQTIAAWPMDAYDINQSSIDYDLSFRVTIDGEISVSGSHDSFPSYSISKLIGGSAIYTYDAPNVGNDIMEIFRRLSGGRDVFPSVGSARVLYEKRLELAEKLASSRAILPGRALLGSRSSCDGKLESAPDFAERLISKKLTLENAVCIPCLREAIRRIEHTYEKLEQVKCLFDEGLRQRDYLYTQSRIRPWREKPSQRARMIEDGFERQIKNPAKTAIDNRLSQLRSQMADIEECLAETRRIEWMEMFGESIHDQATNNYRISD